jgi:type I restriction enzyme M protein
LVPKQLVVARYFAAEQAAIDDSAAKLAAATAKLAEQEEEHGGEEGAFAELEKVNKGNVQAQLREIEGDADAKDEADALKQWLKTKADEDKMKKQVAELESALDAKAYAKYPMLSEDQVKALVVDDKWLAALDARIQSEMDRVSQQLTARVRELAERYDAPLPTLTDVAAELEAKVNDHMERMGYSWK